MRGKRHSGGNIYTEPNHFRTGVPKKTIFKRPIIPSARAIEVDDIALRHSYQAGTQILNAASQCFCVRSIGDPDSTDVSKIPSRLEGLIFVTEYEQCVWHCPEGHSVTPQDKDYCREGLVWISRDTVFTEACLFDISLQVVRKSTIGAVLDNRSQNIHLKANKYPRSPSAYDRRCTYTPKELSMICQIGYLDVKSV